MSKRRKTTAATRARKGMKKTTGIKRARRKKK